MATHVVVAIYPHKHGEDVRVFSKEESVQEWRESIADQWWTQWFDEDQKPDTSAAVAEKYWAKEDACGGEWIESFVLPVED